MVPQTVVVQVQPQESMGGGVAAAAPSTDGVVQPPPVVVLERMVAEQDMAPLRRMAVVRRLQLCAVCFSVVAVIFAVVNIVRKHV